jgi:NAD(P)-dependent dehydrogenase (short-subunit alcohol dehydrogenase family)
MKMKIGNYYITKNGIHPIIDRFTTPTPPITRFEKQGNSLEGKVALVTGGYKGIGLAIVKSFLREGAKIIITGRKTEEMKKIYDTLDKTNISYMEWDISDTANCENFMRNAFNIFNQIDILVNNAGVVTNNNDKFNRKKFLDTDDGYIKYIHHINVFGTITMCQIFSELAKYNKVKIINIISNTAFRPASDAYGLSKHAILSYTYALRKQYDNISVYGIAPGPVKTEMSFRNGSSAVWKSVANLRIGLPEEIAELATMLAGKKGDLISGQVFLCDGGEVLK